MRTRLRAAQRLRPAYGEIQRAVKYSDWVVPDETGWKVGGLLQWLHGFVTALATLYVIRPSRGFDVPCEVLGADYAGDMTHDGWAVYAQFYAAHHGTCSGHLFVRCRASTFRDTSASSRRTSRRFPLTPLIFNWS